MEEYLDDILETVSLFIDTAIMAYKKGDISNTLYCVDSAEIQLMRARNLTVSIFHHGEK